MMMMLKGKKKRKGNNNRQIRKPLRSKGKNTLDFLYLPKKL